MPRGSLSHQVGVMCFVLLLDNSDTLCCSHEASVEQMCKISTAFGKGTSPTDKTVCWPQWTGPLHRFPLKQNDS